MPARSTTRRTKEGTGQRWESRDNHGWTSEKGEERRTASRDPEGAGRQSPRGARTAGGTHQSVVYVRLCPFGHGRRALSVTQTLARRSDAATGSHGNETPGGLRARGRRLREGRRDKLVRAVRSPGELAPPPVAPMGGGAPRRSRCHPGPDHFVPAKLRVRDRAETPGTCGVFCWVQIRRPKGSIGPPGHCVVEPGPSPALLPTKGQGLSPMV